MAYEQAGITNPLQQIDFAEVDDKFAFKLLQHVEALGLAHPGQAGKLLLDGMFQLRGEAGAGQLSNVETGVALSWRGVPHGTGVVTVFRRRS